VIFVLFFFNLEFVAQYHSSALR